MAPVTSGVYDLMSGRPVPPTHRDHPKRRPLCQEAGCSVRWPNQLGQPELMGYTFTASGLQLESAQFQAHQR